MFTSFKFYAYDLVTGCDVLIFTTASVRIAERAMRLLPEAHPSTTFSVIAL